MSDIGFRLKRLLEKRTFTGSFQAYTLGAIVALGPFLLSVVCLASLDLMSGTWVETLDRQAFASAVVYVFGGALIVTGSYQVILTRFLSDKIYAGEYTTLTESLFPALVMTISLCLLTGLPVVFLVDVSLLAKVLILTLYNTVASLFVMMGFISSVSRYRMAVFAFLAAAVVGTTAGVYLGKFFQLEGVLAGYTLGQFLAVAIVLVSFGRDFGFPRKWDWGFLRYFKVFPLLIGIGLFQNLGIWVDKFIFWTSDLGISTYGFVTAPKYDSALFLGFLTAQPAIVHFFVKLEAEFASDFHRYFDEVFFKSPYHKIEAAADNLRVQAVQALTAIAKIQGVITFLAAFMAEEILRFFELPVSQIGMFRSAVLGSFFLVVMLFTNVLLLYLDRQKEVFWAVVVLVVANTVMSMLSLKMGYQFYGFGFAFACLLAMSASLYFLLMRLENLEFGTFAGIPIQGSVKASKSLLARPGGLYGRYNDLGKKQ